MGNFNSITSFRVNTLSHFLKKKTLTTLLSFYDQLQPLFVLFSFEIYLKLPVINKSPINKE